jgi:hypothetical protein
MTAAVPKTNAMLICDYVITEQGTNKKSLIGIFEHIGASQFPVVHHAMSIYVKLTEAQGDYQFRLELVDLKNDRIITQGDLPGKIHITHPLETRELVFNFMGLKFETPGQYEFRIYANDRIFGQKVFMVGQVPNRSQA